MPLDYDLEERTAILGENIIKFCKTIKLDEFNRPLINQIIRSATGVGANYMEANGAASKKDFINKIFICKKETQETKHWLRMLSASNEERKEELRVFWHEAQELTRIFHRIVTTAKKNLLIED